MREAISMHSVSPSAPSRQPHANAANAPSRARALAFGRRAGALDAPVRAVVGTAARAPPRTTLSTEAQSGAEKGCDQKAIRGHQMQSACNQHAISMQSACNQEGCDPKAMRKRSSLVCPQG